MGSDPQRRDMGMIVQDFAEQLTAAAEDCEPHEVAPDREVGKVRPPARDGSKTIHDASPSERHLAQMLSASRSTQREAPRVRHAEGAVEPRPKVETVVVDKRNPAMGDAFSFTIDNSTRAFHDIQGFRRLIEINLADELMSRPSADLLARLETINEAMRRANSASEAAEIDYGFHRTLIDSVENQTLSEIYRVLRPVLRRLMEAGKTKRQAVDGAYNEHSRIIKALRTKDRLAYTFYMTQHLNAGREFIPAPELPPGGDGRRV